jgi:hypothetical protein
VTGLLFWSTPSGLELGSAVALKETERAARAQLAARRNRRNVAVFFIKMKGWGDWLIYR